ncbi:MAG: hypothetical protein HC859_12195 [Bacteroidia bacterium]|nr:hypothetical protein [Bacteroidia bacterium]
METVIYDGKKYSAIRMPGTDEVKLYSIDRRYKGRFVKSVDEKEIHREK